MNADFEEFMGVREVESSLPGRLTEVRSPRRDLTIALLSRTKARFFYLEKIEDRARGDL